jgi:hypothetical protein
VFVSQFHFQPDQNDTLKLLELSQFYVRVCLLISGLKAKAIREFTCLCYFRIVENELFKQDWRSRKKLQIFQYVLLKWAFALLIGLGTGLVGFFNNIAVENIAGFKLLLTSDLMSKTK